MKMYYGQMDLLGCEYNPPTEFDPPKLLKLLYGDQFDVRDTSGSGSVVVLGAHNSGTSMVTRLIMLLGAFGGNYETISIHLHNKLKYYEPFVVSLFHDAFLGKFVDTRFRPYHGQDLNFTSMTVDDRDKLDCFARKYVRDMERHPPWVMKDPRMALTMPLWRPHIKDLVCVFVHKDPIKNSISLAANGKKSSHTRDTDMMTPQRWLSLWETTMLYGLEGCRGVPTVFFSSSNIIPDIRGALTTLKGLLEAAGVRGLKMPSDGEIEDRIQHYIFTGEREYKINKGAQARLNLPEIPITDTTPPTPSHAQVALETSILQMVRDMEEGKVVDFRTVADTVLTTTETLTVEAERNAADRTSGWD